MESDTGLPVVGMIGGGQLARMTHQAAIGMGLSLRVLALDPGDAAARVASEVALGSHTDADAVLRFGRSCDVVTFDHEHVPNDLVRRLAAELQPRGAVHPSAEALVVAQDKIVMRHRLAASGYPVPRWAAVSSADQLLEFAGSWPVVVKSPRGGYDGRGVWLVDSEDHARDLLGRLLAAAPAGPFQVLVEERVPVVRELAALVARSPYGQVSAWPVVETVQDGGICFEVVAPAPDLAAGRSAAAQELAIRLAAELDVVGVMAVELFDTGDDLLVNEVAMRPHNSGHWTIEGSRTSQFEQHLRAVLDYPLGDTTPTARWTVMANVLGGAPGGTGPDERLHHVHARDPAVKVHWYGKAARPGRKLGHVTALGDDLARTRERARAAARWLSTGADEGGRQ